MNRQKSPSSAAIRWPRSASTSAITTLAPSAMNSRVVASPMPLAAPVITARMPSSLPMASNLIALLAVAARPELAAQQLREKISALISAPHS